MLVNTYERHETRQSKPSFRVKISSVQGSGDSETRNTMVLDAKCVTEKRAELMARTFYV